MARHNGHGLTRRAFNQGVAGLALGSGLATHFGSARQASAQVDDAVYTLMEKIFADVAGNDATEVYNEQQNTGPTIDLEDATEGWDAKVLPQIRNDDLRWSGSGYIPFFDQYKQVKAGLAAPLEEYLAASEIPWVQQQEESYFTPRIYEASLLDGVQYYIPMKANVHMAGWRQDYLEAVGYETLPATWDEVDEMLPKIKEAFADDDVIPFAIQRDLFRAIGTTFTTFTEKPLDEQGVFYLESPEWFAMLEMFKKWIDGGLARFDANDISYDAWQKGKFALSLGSHSWVRLGRQVWGSENVLGGVPPQANAEAPARTWAHIDSGCVFNNAPNPQAATDWMLSLFGPEGPSAEIWWEQMLEFSGSPVHQPMIDKFIVPNPEIQEIEEVLALLPDSQLISVAQANGFNICQLKMPPYLDRYFSGELSAEEAMAQVRAEVDEELANQQS